MLYFTADIDNRGRRGRKWSDCGDCYERLWCWRRNNRSECSSLKKCTFRFRCGRPEEEAQTICQQRGHHHCIAHRCWGDEHRVWAHGSTKAAAGQQLDASFLWDDLSPANVFRWGWEGWNSVWDATGGDAALSPHLHLQLRHWSLNISCYFILVSIGFRSSNLLWHVGNDLLLRPGALSVTMSMFVCLSFVHMEHSNPSSPYTEGLKIKQMGFRERTCRPYHVVSFPISFFEMDGVVPCKMFKKYT